MFEEEDWEENEEEEEEDWQLIFNASDQLNTFNPAFSQISFNIAIPCGLQCFARTFFSLLCFIPLFQTANND